MTNESSAKCPQCGASLKESAPAGLCPNCLMALNLKTETVLTGDRPAAQQPLPSEQIAPYFPQLEILESLGRGGMGVVYKARQKSLNRLVALKLLAPERVNDPEFAERFAREAQALAALNHQNIVTVHDFGQAGGFYFLLMEFVDGVSLRQLLRSRKFTPEEALAIVPLLCDALQFAHERGIVHRDIKPDNILLDKAGRVKIADFGIAKMLGAEHNASFGDHGSYDSATQSAIGTPGYIAPEQRTDPQRVDSRADIYSLGVVFYEMLTGELPGKPIAPPSRKVHIDVRLDEVVLRALEKTPERRWQTAAEVRTQVETIVAATNRDGAVESPSRRFNLRPIVTRCVIGAFAALLLIFAGSALFRNFSLPGSSKAELNRKLSTGQMRNGQVRDLLAAMQERVERIQDAAANDRLLEMADTLNQINEYCDQLQGKNQDGGPALEEWGAADSHQFREIMAVLVGLENDAEGMRSIAQGRRGSGAERAALLNQVWNEQFMTKYARLAALLEPKSVGFGQVVQRTIYDEDGSRTNASMIDLDSGKVFSASAFGPERPEQPFITAVEAGLKQMRREQIDLLGDTSGKSFVGFETLVVPAEQPFDLLTAEGIAADKRLAGPAETQVNITVQELPAAYLFKTREGGRGVLEVVRFSTNLESMDFRYKLVRARREFEPVTTLILPSAAGSRRFLNLTDGKSYSEIPAKDPVAYLENDPKDGWRLIIQGIYNYHTEPEKGAKLWESLSAEEIAQPAGLAAAPIERKGFYRVRSQDLPSVVLIPQWGLLRIAEFDDRTTTLVIQHKRVAAGSQADAGKPADSEKRRTSRNQSAEALKRLQQAEAELGRTAKLYATKQVTEEKLDKAKLDVEISTAELKGDDGEAARLRLRKAEAGLEQLTKLHADKLASSEALDEARLNVELQRAALRGDDLEFARIQEQLRQNSDRRSVVEK